MFDAFRGRDIPALISSETNITPESIMSGKIVVLDLPLKELQYTGLMVQSAWKYLFQTALERQHNQPTAPTAAPSSCGRMKGSISSPITIIISRTPREAPASAVSSSRKTFPAFYKEFGRDGADITNSVFGNLNTKVFHNNSDPQTNEWAAKHFGTEIHTRYTVTHAPPPPAQGFL